MSASDGPVLVIGGGVVGAACALELAARGKRVRILERDRFGRGCSHGNCGLVSPSHVLPLCMPGALAKSMRMVLSSGSPLYVRPRFDPELARWLMNFARRCRKDAMLEAAAARAALLLQSMDRYVEMIASGDLAGEWERRGTLFVFASKTGFEHFEEENDLVRDRFGVGAEKWDAEKLLEREPTLRPVVAGAWHYEIDAHVRPDVLMRSWKTLLERRGVEIEEECEFLSLRTERGRIVAVTTSEGEREASQVVFALGAVTPRFADKLGVRIPIQPGKGYSITMGRPEDSPNLPLLFQERKVVATPWPSGIRLGSTMEFSGYDTTVDPKRLKLLTDAAAYHFKKAFDAPVVEEWYGWRPMTYDEMPVIDRLPAFENAYLAAGHGMLGLSMAPATGALVADLMTGATPSVDPAPYRISRFGSRAIATPVAG